MSGKPLIILGAGTFQAGRRLTMHGTLSPVLVLQSQMCKNLKRPRREQAN